MTLQDQKILLASLLELRETYADLALNQQENQAKKLVPSIVDRAERLSRGLYANPNNRGTTPHTN